MSSGETKTEVLSARPAWTGGYQLKDAKPCPRVPSSLADMPVDNSSYGASPEAVEAFQRASRRDKPNGTRVSIEDVHRELRARLEEPQDTTKSTQECKKETN